MRSGDWAAETAEGAMDESSRLQRQRSWVCPPLSVGICYGSRGSAAGFERMAADESYDDDRAFAPRYPFVRRSARTPASRLRSLWRRIVREKRSVINPAADPLAYDPHSYAQNFDDGVAWAEPENLSRSFSARFAIPFRVLS